MFLTLEGMEGAGKSTLAQGLLGYFEKEGHTVRLTREPGGSELGKKLRSMLLDIRSRIADETELFLFLADRAQHVAEVIRPALVSGETVVCDRYADSTIVYQGWGRGFEPAGLFQLNDLAVRGLWPDCTFILDLPPEEGLRRALARNQWKGMEQCEGRFEAEDLSFHTRIRDGFLEWASRNEERCIVLDAMLPPGMLLEQAWKHIVNKLSMHTSLSEEVQLREKVIG